MSRLTAEDKLKRFAYGLVSSHHQGLITLQMDLTDFCVCKCKGCEHWKWPVKTKLDGRILDRNVFPYLDRFDNLQSVVLSGGEPLLHPEVEDIVKRLNQEYNLHVGIISSGLGKANIDWKTLSENCKWIRFSTDGFNVIDYELTRGVPLFDKWTDNLKTLLAENRNTKCETRLNVTIHQFNIDTFTRNLLDFLEKNGITIDVYFWLSREFIDLFENFYGQGVAAPEAAAVAKKICKAFKNLSEDRLKLSINGTAVSAFNTDNVDKRMEYFGHETLKYRSCFAPQMFSLIASDGNVFPCCYMYEPVFTMDQQQLQFVIGNINNQSIADIYTSRRYYDIVDTFRHCNKKFNQCKFCDRYDHLNKYLNDFKITTEPIFL